MIFSNPYFDTLEKMDLLERWLLVHSILYYDLDETSVSDNVYNENALQLQEMIKKYPSDFVCSRYHRYFIDFDSSSLYNVISNVKQYNKQLYKRLKYDALIALENYRKKL